MHISLFYLLNIYLPFYHLYLISLSSVYFCVYVSVIEHLLTFYHLYLISVSSVYFCVCICDLSVTHLSLGVYHLSMYLLLVICIVIAVYSLSRVWLSDPMDCSMPGFRILDHLLEFAQTHVHGVGDAIQCQYIIYIFIVNSSFMCICVFSSLMAFLVAQMVKNLPTTQEIQVQSLGQGRSPGEGNGYPLQYSGLEFLDRGAWRATAHGVAQRWAWLTD